MSMKFTLKSIKALPVPTDRRFRIYTDEQIKKFGVKVWSTGSKMYIVRAPRNGRDTTVSLGNCNLISLHEARLKAVELINGKKQDNKKGKKTFAEVLQFYWEEHVLVKNSERTQKDKLHYKSFLENEFRGKAFEDIDKESIKKLHNEYKRRHGVVQANKFLAMIKNMYNIANDLDISDRNPAKKIDKFHEKSRERWMSNEELKRWMKAIRQEPSPYKEFYITLIYTGARSGSSTQSPGEVRTMKWSDIDFEKGVWVLKDTKNRSDHFYHLHSDLIYLLKKLPRVSEYVFAGKKRTPINGLSKSWKRIRKNSGINDIKIHDVRRTFGCMLANMEGKYSMKQIMSVMNHKSIRAGEIYQKISDSTKERAAQDIGTHLRQLAPALT